MANSLNARHLLIMALGYNDYLEEEVERLYEARRWEYYETFKNSGFYDDVIIKTFTIQKEARMRKVVGIVEWSYNNDDFTLIDQLIKKGYKNVLRYYEQNKNKINLEQFVIYFLKRLDKEIFEIPEIEITMHHAVLLYLANKDQINFTPIFNTPYGEVVISSLNHLILDAGRDILLSEKMKLRENSKEESIIFLENVFGLKLNKKHPNVVSNIFDFVIDAEIERQVVAGEITSKSGITPARRVLFTTLYFKHLGAYSSVLKLSGINYGDLLNVFISDDDLINLSYNALLRIEENEFTIKEATEFLISSLFTYSLLEHYKKQKNELLNDATESWYVDVKNREKHLNESVRFYENMKENLEKNSSEEVQKRMGIEKKMKDIEKENMRLKLIVEQTEEDKAELIELRNFVYNQTKTNASDVELNKDKTLEVLNDKKIVICGGHPNMIRKIKEKIQGIETISTDTLGKDFAYLNKYDVVYFYPNYANHSFYKKIKQSIRSSNTKFVYLPDIDNTERIIMEMYDKVVN